MGIEGFGDIVKKHSPNCFFEFPLNNFRGHKVSVDMSNLIYMMMSASTKQQLADTDVSSEDPDEAAILRRTTEMIMNKLEAFMDSGVIPVCVFDGVPDRLKGQGKKKSKKGETHAKFEEAKRKLRSTDIFARNQVLVDDYIKYYKQDVRVPHEYTAELRRMLKSIGFPVVWADETGLRTKDAEGICAALCMNGYCIAGYTTDSDFHVYGGNWQIIEITPRATREGTVHYAQVRILEHILAQTGLAFDQFRDLCILLGSDYNKNIPGIGPVKAWNKIKIYGSIAQMSVHEDVSILNYPEVIQIFSSTVVEMKFDAEFRMELFRENAREIFGTEGLHDHTGKILRALELMQRPQFIVTS